MYGNIRDVRECHDCGSDNIFYNDNLDQVICRDCGLIFEPFANEGGDEEDDMPARQSAPKQKTAKPKKAVKKPAKKAKKK